MWYKPQGKGNVKKRILVASSRYVLGDLLRRPEVEASTCLFSVDSIHPGSIRALLLEQDIHLPVLPSSKRGKAGKTMTNKGKTNAALLVRISRADSRAGSRQASLVPELSPIEPIYPIFSDVASSAFSSPVKAESGDINKPVEDAHAGPSEPPKTEKSATSSRVETKCGDIDEVGREDPHAGPSESPQAEKSAASSPTKNELKEIHETVEDTHAGPTKQVPTEPEQTRPVDALPPSGSNVPTSAAVTSAPSRPWYGRALSWMSCGVSRTATSNLPTHYTPSSGSPSGTSDSTTLNVDDKTNALFPETVSHKVLDALTPYFALCRATTDADFEKIQSALRNEWQELALYMTGMIACVVFVSSSF